MQTQIPETALVIDQRAETPEAIVALTQQMRAMDDATHDYVVPGRALSMNPDATLTFALDNDPDSILAGFQQTWPLRRYAHGQLADTAGIPQKYYDRLLAADRPLLAENVNRWLPDVTNRLVRTVNGQVRAVVSDRFFPIDAIPLFFNLLRAVRGSDIQVKAVHLTERYFTTELVQPGVEYPIRYRTDGSGPGGRGYSRVDPDRVDTLVPYCTVRTSDVGAAALSVGWGGKRLSCWNGLTTSKAFVQRHLGSQLPVGILQQDTIRASAEAILFEARDMALACFDPTKFAAFVNQIEEATGFYTDQPVEAVKILANHYKLSQDEMDAMVQEFLRPSTDIDPGLTLWGAVNAVTWLSHTAEGDRRYELEQIGGAMLEEGARLLQPVLARR